MHGIIRNWSKSLVLMAVVFTCYLPVTLLAEDYTIDYYKPGKISVNGERYENNIVILPDGSIEPGPDDMHYVSLSEIEDIISIPGIRTLVIGTGYDGKGTLSNKLIKVVRKKGVELKMMLTKDAMKFLNETPKEGLVAMLHLNC
ncbi:MAG: MTH938/NDUFAF3 family protein [Thermodesulfobacteriota bacterium]